jgi:hypothetical protein
MDYSEATPEERTAALEALGLSLEATFVPFSQSKHAKRNEDGKVWRSLNWKVTIKQNGKELIVTDYAQGDGHTPAYKKGHKSFSGPRELDRAIAAECEKGVEVQCIGASTDLILYRHKSFMGQRTPVSVPNPSLLEVCYSLTSDAQSGAESFEDFCSNFGYDTDSRKARKTWKACQKIAFKLGRELTEKIGQITEGY